MRYLVLIGFILSFSSVAFCDVFNYIITVNDNTFSSIYEVNTSDSGFFLSSITSSESNIDSQAELELDSAFSTIRWKYIDSNEGIQVSAYRENGFVNISGHKGRKSVTRKIKVDSLPWIQYFPMQLKQFVTSPEESITFFAIHPTKLKAAKFKATKKREETLVIGKEVVDAVHVKISFPGWKSVLWSAESWHRKTDGIFVKYIGKNGALKPIAITELIE